MFDVGSLVRYSDGPSALMRVTAVRGDRVYGRGFYSSGTCTSRYVGDCRKPSEQDGARWAEAHDENDQWIRGKW